VELRHLRVHIEHLEHMAQLASTSPVPIVLSSDDANATMVVASLADQLSGPIGVWLDISEDYSSPLAARDVATLSWLVQLDHVVIAAPEHARAHADVVRALLSNDEVNFTNDVATLRGAYNRPAPPRPVTIWHVDGATVRHDDVVLVERARVDMLAGELITFVGDSATE